jgi:hypothetical protein
MTETEMELRPIGDEPNQQLRGRTAGWTKF